MSASASPSAAPVTAWPAAGPDLPAGECCAESDALAANLSITVHRGVAGLHSIRDDWETITSRMAGRRHHIHLWDWHQSHLECLAADPGNVVFHVARKGSRPVAILPLEEVPHGSWLSSRIRRLRLPCHKHTVLSDMICDPEAEAQDIPAAMVRHLRRSPRRWDILRITGVPANTSCLGRVSNRLPGPVMVIARTKCDSLAHQSPSALLANVSKNFRANLRKARNKLASLPNVRFELVRDAAQLPRALEQFCAVEASGWKGAAGRGTAIALHPAAQSFYRQLAERFGASQRCFIHLLKTGDTCIAGQFCLALDQTVYILKIGFDESNSALAPGNMLLERLIAETSAGTGPVTSWNLITGAKWHRDWKPLEEPVHEILIFNHTLRGLGLYLALRVKRWCAGLRNRLSRAGQN